MSGPGRVAIHTDAARVTSGGGLTYVTAIAAALTDPQDVDLFLPFASSREELAAWMPEWPGRAHVRREPPNRSWRDELRLARDDRRWAVALRETSAIPRLTLARRSLLVTSFPFEAVGRARDRARLASYSSVIANSAFTAHWVAERWNRRAEVLHPPVPAVTPREKRRVILAVGRFSDGGRSKRQLEMVDAFRALGPDAYDGWELQLAGFVEDPSYVAAVRERASGLPVTILPDLDRASLERLYGEASLFWHACGLGIDERREPHRVEHFGITTAEAMSAGCVPIVLGAGGQPEIVGPGGGVGVLWRTVDEWVDATRALIGNPDRRSRLSAGARTRATRFSFEAFTRQARALVLGDAPPDAPGADAPTT